MQKTSREIISKIIDDTKDDKLMWIMSNSTIVYTTFTTLIQITDTKYIRIELNSYSNNQYMSSIAINYFINNIKNSVGVISFYQDNRVLELIKILNSKVLNGEIKRKN